MLPLYAVNASGSTMIISRAPAAIAVSAACGSSRYRT